jgi:hypothetical protein
MKQIKVFKGKINGEVFDNVNSYNTRMTELISAGVTNIEATSSTSIKMVEDEPMDMTTGLGTNTPIAMIPEDEDLTFYPYFEDEDPHYLDLLVTDDSETNAEAYNEANRQLDKCFLYITDNLYDKDVDINVKKEYLHHVANIISDIKSDNEKTTKALRSVDTTRAQVAAEFREAQAAFTEAQAKYNEAVRECDYNQSVLQASKPVIARMLEFYRGVEQEALQAIAEHNSETCEKCETCPTCGNCKCHCTCGTAEPEVKCNVKEVSPQQLSDVSDWFDRVLQACGL